VRLALCILIALAGCRSELGRNVDVAPTAAVTRDGGILPVPVPVPDPPAVRAGITARVTAGGAPVAGAEVRLSDGSSPTRATAITDADGLARFDGLEPGPYEVWARHELAVSPVARLVRDDGVEPDATTELALVAGGGVHGKVTTRGALPPGATVRLEPVGLDHALRVAPLDASGGFAIDGVPRGKWRLVADAPGFFRDADPDDVVTVSTSIVTADLALIRGGQARGTVVDADGAPVANATLVLRDRAGVRTGPIAPPSVKLRWVHPLAGARHMPRFDTSHFGTARTGVRPAECGRGHCGVDLGGKKGTPVHASADGEVTRVVRTIHPEAGRYVVVEHAGGVHTHYLHLDEIRADLQVGVRVRAGDPLGTIGRTGAASGPHLHFAMSQERQGRSYYFDPEPILLHAVVLAKSRGLDWNGPASDAPTAIAPVADAATAFATDASGQFHLDGIAPGDYVITAYHPTLAPGVSAPFAILAGTLTGGVAITLSPGVAIRGRVLARGVPVAGARVVAEEGAGESSHRVATAYTDARGEYELHAVSGKVVLAASASGYGAAERAIDLGAGGKDRAQREDFELVVADGKLFGEVRDDTGRGVGGVTVKILEGPTTRRRTVTDPSGSFLITGVPRGDYVLELAADDYPARRADVTSDRPASITLARGGSVRIDLRDAHTNDGLARVEVTATGPGGVTRRPITDAGGLAEVRGLTPGSWTFRVRAPGYTGAERTLDVGAAPLELRLDLARGAVVAGIVRDALGRRASGARVWIGDVETRADDDGNFRIDDAPTGSVELQAALGDATGARALELRPGDELVTLTLDLTEAR